MSHVAPARIPSALLNRPLSVATLLGLAATVSGPLTPSLHASAACDDISGVYEVLVDLPGGGPTEIELDLEQSECEVTGFVGARTRTPIQNGSVEGSTASFTFEAQNQGSGGTLVIQWVITIEGDDVTGTFSNELFGDVEVVGSRAGISEVP
jgi:hypothetical protein